MTSRSVLVAEDQSINRMYLVSLLENHGFSCTAVKNGREAVAAFREASFGAVLMDYQMPVMNGLDAVREIRGLETEGSDRVPIIVLTAYDEEEDRVESRHAGADLLLVKPFSEVELIETLESVLSGTGRSSTGA